MDKKWSLLRYLTQLAETKNAIRQPGVVLDSAGPNQKRLRYTALEETFSGRTEAEIRKM